MNPAADPLPVRRAPAITVLGAVLILSLGLNALLIGWLWRTQSAQDARLARLERLAGPVAPVPAPRFPKQANRQDRLAFLLAAAGNSEESRQILSAISPEDTAEMIRALIARPAANDRNEALDAALRSLALDNPSVAVELLGSVEDSGLRIRLARHVVAVWTAASPEAAARWLAQDGGGFFDPGQSDDLLGIALGRWAAFAPEAAARFAVARPPDGPGGPSNPAASALLGACREWGRKDPPVALAWAQSLPATDPRRREAVDGVLGGWTEKDPAGAARFARQAVLANPAASVGSALVVVRAWADADPAAAARWAAALPDQGVRAVAIREGAVQWAGVDAMAAALWAGALPDDGTRGGVWSDLTELWARANPAQAESWLTGLPAGPDRDDATAVYIARLARFDPEKALTWARTLTGPAFAAGQVDHVLAQWEQKDAAAARNWAAANGVALPVLQGGR